VLLRAGPESMTLEGKKLCQHLQTLLHAAAEQQVESLAYRRCEARARAQECSVHRGSSRPWGQLGRAESVHSPSGRRVDSNRGARGASSVRGKTMTRGGSDGEREGSTAGGARAATTAAKT
jgi:hypothetical protein